MSKKIRIKQRFEQWGVVFGVDQVFLAADAVADAMILSDLAEEAPDAPGFVELNLEEISQDPA